MEAFDFSVGSFGDQRLEKVGRDFHEALVERASPRIRRLARGRAQEVQFHRMLRNLKVGAAEMAASAGARTGLQARGRDIALARGYRKLRTAAFISSQALTLRPRKGRKDPGAT